MSMSKISLKNRKIDACVSVDLAHDSLGNQVLNSARIVLLCKAAQPSERTSRLLTKLGIEISHYYHWSPDEVIYEGLDRCDLILFEAFEPTIELQAALRWLRQGSRAPLVVLTISSRSEQTMAALVAGADVVSATNSDLALLHAQWSALVRRWQRPRRRADFWLSQG